MLVVLYEATDGANWKVNTNWLSEKPLDEWYGVTTDEEGRGLTLNLEWNELTGGIPAELGQLENLTHLSLTGNELTGAYPSRVSPTEKPDTPEPYRQRVDGGYPSRVRPTGKPDTPEP